jgi:hydroxypyruvate isomerase
MERRELLQSGAALLTAAFASNAQQPLAPRAKITSSAMLWTLKGSFEEKLETAARAGVQSVELVGEYADWTDTDIARVKKFARSLRLGIDVLIATPNWQKRPVSMVDPAQRENFLADLQKAITVASRLEVPQILLMSGNAIPGRTHEEQYGSLLEGCKRAGIWLPPPI